ncbi:GSCFA family protein [Nitrosomonas sp. Nm34]|nr:GSCFA family protein [Nitrosomonas sp. Nm34]
MSDLKEFIQKAKSVNKDINILITVLPVPLITTYENRHVLTSTIASKSTLRVAADEAERLFDNVIYFPSYEIVTSPANGGRYLSVIAKSAAHGIISRIAIESVIAVEPRSRSSRLPPYTLSAAAAISGNVRKWIKFSEVRKLKETENGREKSLPNSNTCASADKRSNPVIVPDPVRMKSPLAVHDP